MAKHSKSVSLIIVAVDFKFKAFDYERFEIDFLKRYFDVIILYIIKFTQFKIKLLQQRY